MRRVESSTIMDAVGNPRLLDQVRRALRVRRYSPRTEEAYIGWIRRFVLSHGKRHPRELGTGAIGEFLTDLAERRGVSASTQSQAASALIFLYEKVLGIHVGRADGVVRAKRSRRLPVVLTREEVREVLGRLQSTKRLVVLLLYGSGLRLMECLRLRVKDLDLERWTTGSLAEGSTSTRQAIAPALPSARRTRMASSAVEIESLLWWALRTWLPIMGGFSSFDADPPAAGEPLPP